ERGEALHLARLDARVAQCSRDRLGGELDLGSPRRLGELGRADANDHGPLAHRPSPAVGTRRHWGSTWSSPGSVVKTSCTGAPISIVASGPSSRLPTTRGPSGSSTRTTTYGASIPGTGGWWWITKLWMVPTPSATTQVRCRELHAAHIGHGGCRRR